MRCLTLVARAASPGCSAACAVALVATLTLASPAAAKRRTTPLPCPEGRFNVSGAALMDPFGDDDAIVIQGTQLSVASGCGPANLIVRQTKKGFVLRARWKRCTTTGGAVRLQASFSEDCEELEGRVIKRARFRRAFGARRHRSDGAPVPPPDDPGEPAPDTGTFAMITDLVFARRGCTASACHGQATAAGLDLRRDAAYASLVDVAATSAPGEKRVVPGLAADSFLSRKLRGLLAPSEGARMPLGGEQLSVLERDVIDIWINGGAPETGKVPGAPELRPEGYVPAAPPPPPPGGVQLLLDGPTLRPGEETEGCLWVPAPNLADVLIGRVEVTANPGTHHVVVWRYTAPGTPQTNTWRNGDIACLSGSNLGTTGLAGAGMGNGSDVGLPAGVASVLPGGGYFGLNAHYYNEFDVPIQVKVWFNFFPYEGTPDHIAEGLTSLDTTFDIRVDPFTQKIRRGRYVNASGGPMHVLTFGGHMHKRGVRFSAWFSNGTKIFDDYDWAHPVGRPFDPPYVLAPGDWIDYECLHDNGVTRPVRRDQSGQPRALSFGISAEDEMCILTASFYRDL